MRPVGYFQECDYVSYVFVFLGSIITGRQNKLTLSDQAQVTLQPNQSFRFSGKILGRPVLAWGEGGGRGEHFFYRGPNELALGDHGLT